MADAVQVAGNQADFLFFAGEYTADDLRVTGFTGTEGISELFHFRVELSSSDRNVDATALVGQACRLEISSSAGTRYVHGIIRSFARTREGSQLTHYAAEIVPRHWLLTRRYKSRIFQKHNCSDMTVVGIVKKVLADAGLPESSQRVAVEGTWYPELDFVVQYRESDFDFISRLMEQYGIFYFFDHTAEGCKLVIGDSGVAHVADPLDAERPYRDPNGLVNLEEFIFAARDRQEIQIGAICLDDFNFSTPQVDLRATVKADKFTELEFSDYPGQYAAKPDGPEVARVRLELHQAARRVVELETVVRGLMPGFKFTMIDHPAESLNIEYLVTHVTHRAVQRQSAEAETDDAGATRHETRMQAIPATILYRPPLKTRAPVVLGSQTALVVGPEGEEIYTDDDGFGRVKVQFHWDREGEHNENSSFWVRVSQGWAGGNYGMLFLPRVGQEVIVDFLEGNPNYPIITGRVYNADNMPPYPLPDEKTKSTIKTRSSTGGGGFNELRFDDKKDSEMIFLHAQKDMDERILNDRKVWVERDHHETVKKNRKTSVEGGESLTVGGDQLTNVGGKCSFAVEGDYAVAVTGQAAIGADGDLYLVGTKTGVYGDSYAELSGASVHIEGDSITLKSGGNFITIGPAGVAIKGSMVMINSGGAAGAAQSVGMASTQDAAAPLEPLTGDPGQDFTYQNTPLPYDPLEHAELHDNEEPGPEKHWIGIRLFDDNGEPLPGERYQVVLPDGTKVARGTTNEKGEAEIKGIDPGSCQIEFPDLDAATWDVGPPAPGEGDGGGSGGASPAGAPGGGGLPSAPSVPGL